MSLILCQDFDARGRREKKWGSRNTFESAKLQMMLARNKFTSLIWKSIIISIL